jgi:uncharacterized protein
MVLDMIFENLLQDVLSDWSYWTEEPLLGIPREALNEIPQLHSDIALVIQGVRRCGKSTLLAQIMKHFDLPSQRCFFINFEDPRLSDSLDPTLLDALLRFADTTVGSEQPRYFFLDEIQALKNWEKWLRFKLDKPKGDVFFITGSNSSLLSGELGSVLTGRHLVIELFPFSFTEYRSLKPEGGLLNYLVDGGFPKPLQVSEHGRLLRQYFTDIIERDVRRHVAARSVTTISQVAKALYESAGSELSARGLAKRIDIATDTMLTYLEALKLAYLALPCPYFTFSERKRMVRHTKWYPIDCGLRQSVITSGSDDIGKNFETVVFHLLCRTHEEVYYWRGASEVDFIVMEGNVPRPIQVSWDGPKDRHRKGIVEFQQTFAHASKPLFISHDNFSKIELLRE